VAIAGGFRWELRNGLTGTFEIEWPDPVLVEALVMAMQLEIPFHLPEITAMPDFIITEVTYSISMGATNRVEVWFREPDGQT